MKFVSRLLDANSAQRFGRCYRYLAVGTLGSRGWPDTVRLRMTKNETLSKRYFDSLWARPGFLIRRAHQIHVALFLEECAEFNITPAQFAVLTVLNTRKTLDQISIAQEIGFDRNTVADVIRRLERRGLVERPASVEDKRAKLARITKKGIDFVDAVQPAMIRAQRRLTKPISSEDHLILTRILTKLIRENNENSRAPLRPTRHFRVPQVD